MSNKPTLDEILRVVRDAGAWDDNMGGEDWSHSDRSIASAKQQLTQLIADIIGEDWEQNFYRDKFDQLFCKTCGGDVFGGVCECSSHNRELAEQRQTAKELGIDLEAGDE